MEKIVLVKQEKKQCNLNSFYEKYPEKERRLTIKRYSGEKKLSSIEKKRIYYLQGATALASFVLRRFFNNIRFNFTIPYVNYPWAMFIF